MSPQPVTPAQAAAESAAAANRAAPDDIKRRRPQWGRVIGFTVLIVVLLTVVIAVWVGVRGAMAFGELSKARDSLQSVQSELTANPDQAAELAAGLQQHTRSAADLTGDPLWWLVEQTPWLGPNLTAFREVTGVANTVASGAVTPLANAAEGIDLASFTAIGGSIDLQPLVDAQPALAQASGTMAQAITSLDAIDVTDVVAPLRDAVVQVQDLIVPATETVDALDRAVTLLPAMLGADGPRQYLVLFQNPAELRSGGGIPGAMAAISADGGAITLGDQASSADFPEYPEPVGTLPQDVRGIYGDLPGIFVQNVTMLPRFDLSAQLASKMWRMQTGQTVDGVISVDPVALSYLLRATGPITLPTGDVLSANNAVELLLNGVYQRYPDPAAQDAFFAAAAAFVFQQISSGDLDPQEVFSALAQATSERRIQIWSADKPEQALLAETTLAAGLPVSTPDTAAFGVYFNDATGAKMDYYLDTDISVTGSMCTAEDTAAAPQTGDPVYTVTTTLTNNAPADAASTLADYITGAGGFGVMPGNVKTTTYVYAPLGLLYAGGSVDGQESSDFITAIDAKRTVARVTAELTPGESVTIVTKFTGPYRTDAVPRASGDVDQNMAANEPSLLSVASTPTTTDSGQATFPCQ